MATATWVRLGGSAIAGYAAYVALCMAGGASLEVAGRPVDALVLYPSSRVAAQAAEQALAHGEVDEAAFYARMALTRSAYSQAALRVLGTVAQTDGQPLLALRFYTLGAGLGWRDTATTLWLFRHALLDGDTRAVAIQGDAIARRKRGVSMIMIRFRQMLASPDGVDAVTRQLAGRPPWRNMFFRELGNATPLERAGLRVLTARLRAAGMPATALECAPLAAAAATLCGLPDA